MARAGSTTCDQRRGPVGSTLAPARWCCSRRNRSYANPRTHSPPRNSAPSATAPFDRSPRRIKRVVAGPCAGNRSENSPSRRNNAAPVRAGARWLARAVPPCRGRYANPKACAPNASPPRWYCRPADNSCSSLPPAMNKHHPRQAAPPPRWRPCGAAHKPKVTGFTGTPLRGTDV